MKSLTNILILLIAMSLLTGCLVFPSHYGASPGLIYQNTTLNHVFPKGTDLGSRVGTSCVTGYAGLWSTGDAGVRAAAAEGGITTIRAVDYSIESYGMLYIRNCSIAYGD